MDRVLSWFYIEEWDEREHPKLGKIMLHTLYCDHREGRVFLNVFSAPMVDKDDNIYCYEYDPERGVWEDETLYLGKYNGQEHVDYYLRTF